MFIRCLLAFGFTLYSLEGALRISEFSAGGQGTLKDDREEFPDWLELENDSAERCVLTGYYLTDDPDELTKWTFPRGQSVAAGKRLIIFASGQDRSNIFANTIHSNFTLETSKGYLALVAPDGLTVIDEWRSYPKQRPGLTYGRGADGNVGFFESTTPGEANPAATAEIVKDTKFSVDRGFYEEPLALTLSTSTAGAVIYFTRDGSLPTVTPAQRFQEAILINQTTIIRAMAVKEGMIPSNIDTHSYLFIDSVINQPEAPEGFPARWGTVPADYAMDASLGSREAFKEALLGYPSVSLVMPIDSWFHPSRTGGEGGIYANSTATGLDWEKVVSAEFLNVDGSKDTQVDCGIRVYGNASRQTSRPKHNLRLAFRARYGDPKLEVPIFGRGKATGINGLLFNGQNGDSWFHPTAGQREAASYVRDHFAHELLGDMGHLTPPQSRAHVYVNGLYWGFYQTVERVDDHFMARVFGGEPEEYDSMKASLQAGPTLVAGDTRAYEKLFELADDGVEDDAAYVEIQQYLDLDAFIDYMLINFWTGNRDWDNNNWRSGRHRSAGSPWHYVMWDSENIFKDASIDKTGSNTADNPTRLHQQLAKNPRYRLKFADHVRRHLFNDGLLTQASVQARWRRWSDYVRSGLLAESARWSDHHRPGRPYTVDEDYKASFQMLMNTIIPARATIALRQFENRDLYPKRIAPVDFSQHGGSIDGELSLGLRAGTIFQQQTGDIVYTLDGTDPMDGGLVYGSPLRLATSTTVKARVRSDSGEWSPLTEARFSEGLPPQPGELVISEIHYHPGAVTAEEDPLQVYSRTDFEFLEIWNRSDRVLQLQGVALTEGVRFDFPELSLSPGERGVMVENGEAFRSRYGDVRVLGTYTGQLANGGEQLTLSDKDGGVLHTLFYDDEEPWPSAADGDGLSLTLILDDLPDAAVSWAASARAGGTPGLADGAIVGRLAITLGNDEDGGPMVIVTLDAGMALSEVTLQRSDDLVRWAVAEDGESVTSDGLTRRWRVGPPSGATHYYRAVVRAEAE